MTPSPTDLVVDALAVARIVRLLQVDEIPVGKLRETMLDRHGEHLWTELLRCPWCASIWVAAGVVVARAAAPRPWSFLARVLAGSQVTGHLAEMAHS